MAKVGNEVRVRAKSEQVGKDQISTATDYHPENKIVACSHGTGKYCSPTEGFLGLKDHEKIVNCFRTSGPK
jgi:hypothetical protein